MCMCEERELLAVGGWVLGDGVAENESMNVTLTCSVFPLTHDRQFTHFKSDNHFVPCWRHCMEFIIKRVMNHDGGRPHLHIFKGSIKKLETNGDKLHIF